MGEINFSGNACSMQTVKGRVCVPKFGQTITLNNLTANDVQFYILAQSLQGTTNRSFH